MNGICGWMSWESPAASDDIAKMLRALSNGQATDSKISADWAIGLTAFKQSCFEWHVENNLIVGLVKQSAITPSNPSLTSAALLAKEFATKKEKAFAALQNAFTAIVIDTKQQSVSVAIDRMGIYPLAFTQAGNSLLFGSSCDAINAHPLATPDIDLQALYQYLYFHMIPAPGSIYKNYRKLLPGEYLTFSKGKLTVGTYWEMHFDENYRASFSDLKQEFLSTLRNSVKQAAAGMETGCFLSGGTDSSTMSGMLGEVSGKPARTYSIGFDEPGYDETGFARIAAKHFRTDHHEYYVKPVDIVEAIPLIARGYDQPFGNSSAVPTFYCARMAKQDGIEQLIGGDGGDELFGGNERYAKQYIFSLYENIPSPLRNGLVSPMVNCLPDVGLLRKAKSYVQQASVPMPARLETYNLLDRIGKEKIFTPAFLQQVNTDKPIEHINQIYHQSHANTQTNRMLALDFRITLADNDLPKVSNTCAIAKMNVAFPILADSVVAFSSKLDPELKLKKTKLRYFFKEALRGFLPDEILTKQKHGFGLPFGPWMNKHKPLHELVISSLQNLKRRNIIQPEFIDELTSQHLSAHAGYYGTMVWVLMILEQWLAAHAPNFSLAA